MEHFEKYDEFSKNENWAGICNLNDVDLDSFGTKKELKALPEYLESDETVFALTSGIMEQTETSNYFDFGTNTWLVVLTSDRFLFLDAAMLTRSVDTQSIRHNMVQAVSASQGLLMGKITIDLGSRMLVIDNCQKATVKIIANLANKWLKEIEENKKPQTTINHPVSEYPLIEKLEILDKLFKLNAISDIEFNEAREKILTSEDFQNQKKNLLSALT